MRNSSSPAAASLTGTVAGSAAMMMVSNTPTPPGTCDSTPAITATENTARKVAKAPPPVGSRM